MNHTVRIKRHLVRDILASVVGGSLVVAAAQKSWIGGALAVLAGVALYFTERADIQEEEQ
jgi:hypothetical protein